MRYVSEVTQSQIVPEWYWWRVRDIVRECYVARNEMPCDSAAQALRCANGVAKVLEASK